MPTVYARVRRQGLPMTPEQKREIGKIIVDAYFAHPMSGYRALHKVPETKEDDARLVLSYPKDFAHEMDLLIREYWKRYKSAQKTAAKRLSEIKTPKQRTRRPAQPLYSFKPKNQ